MADDKLKEIFLIEADELITDLETGLVSLEEDPDDSEMINQIFRAAHTLKGSAGLVGLDKVVEFTHVMENLLDRLRDGQVRVSNELISCLLQSVDVVKIMIENVSSGVDVQSVDGQEEALNSLNRFMGAQPEVEQEQTPEPTKPKADTKAKSKENIFQIFLKFSSDFLDSGQDPILLFEELSDLGEVLENEVDNSDLPHFDDLDTRKIYLTWRFVLKTELPFSQIENVFIFVMDDNPIRISDITETYVNGVDTSDADKKIGELLVEEGALTEQDVEEAVASQKRTGEILVEKGKVSQEKVQKVLKRQARARAVKRTSVIRVDTEKLDKLVNLVGELVTGIAQLNQLVVLDTEDVDTRVASVKALEQISRDLQETVMFVRMVPVEETFSRFKRVVRDLANEVGKKVNLETRGTETELDKNVIEQLVDPLKHLVRNCVDHGLETPEQRIKNGKSETGTVFLRASQREGNIYIEVGDDGAGIDREKVLAKAIQKGLVPKETLATDDQLLQVLFEPGFSTADQITDLSGRGVGMDVVRRNVEDLRGSIEVTTKKNQGSTFRIKLPLTLAIIDGMNVKVGSEIFTIPLLSIIEQIRPTKEDVKTVEGKGELVDVRGEYLPMVRLHDLFGFNTERTDPSKALVVVLENEGRKYGVLVDNVLGQQQAVIKALDKNFKKVDGIAGATILGDGTISLILDVHGMERMAFQH